MATPRTLRLNAADNVIIALDMPAGAALAKEIAARHVPKGHKLAACPIARGAPI